MTFQVKESSSKKRRFHQDPKGELKLKQPEVKRKKMSQVYQEEGSKKKHPPEQERDNRSRRTKKFP
jgi:hypothetical protein